MFSSENSSLGYAFYKMLVQQFLIIPGVMRLRQTRNNLLLDSYFSDVMKRCQSSWRKIVSSAVTMGIPVPALSSALMFFDGYRSERLPANLLQAQRD
jgi:6-phosphogluconate dehydrogenase